jgi:hypothetical protein
MSSAPRSQLTRAVEAPAPRVPWLALVMMTFRDQVVTLMIGLARRRS